MTRVSDDFIKVSLPHGSAVKLSSDGDEVTLQGK